MTPNAYAPATTSDVVAAGLILRRDTPKGFRWLLLRASKHGEWGFPKGHQDPGETPVQTALRECAEECGKSKSVIYYPAVTAQSEVDLSDEHHDFAWLSARETINRLPHANLVLLFRAYLNSLGKG